MADKQKALKDITAAVRKHKSLVKSDIELLSPLASGSTNKNPPGKSAVKCPKIIKASHILNCLINY